MDSRLARLKEEAKAAYANGDAGHDWTHIQRVEQSCLHLGAQSGARLEVLIPAAILHDFVNTPKDAPCRTAASAASANAAVGVLKASGYSTEEVALIRQIIIEHSYSLGLKASSLESAILQDADRLDELGAVGILRAVTCGCQLNSTYYDALNPFGEERTLNGPQYVVDHLMTRLLNMDTRMNTGVGRREARRRIQFIREFLAELSLEIGRGFSPAWHSDAPTTIRQQNLVSQHPLHESVDAASEG
ncbi:uncharacterized protein ACVIU7_009392 [Bradyrhizobium liaoningense]